MSVRLGCDVIGALPLRQAQDLGGRTLALAWCSVAPLGLTEEERIPGRSWLPGAYAARLEESAAQGAQEESVRDGRGLSGSPEASPG